MTARTAAHMFLLAGTAVCASNPTGGSLRFEPNLGQTDSTVAFFARAAGRSVFLHATGATFRSGPAVWKMHLVGASPNALAVGLDALDARANYLTGRPGKRRAGVPLYGRVRYRGVYPGVDLVFSGDAERVRYELVAGAGAELAQIRFRFEGADGMRFEANGDCIVRGRQGELRHTDLQAWQSGAAGRQSLAARFRATGADEIGIDVGHNTSQALTMTFSTYLGGSGQDVGSALAIDTGGNLYVTGYTESVDFPEMTGSQLGHPRGVDVYVAKLTPAGKLLYLTYLGGSGSDQANGIAVDSSGSAIVVGATYSSDFPVLSGAHPYLGGGKDGFIAKLNAAGTALVFATYLGGRGADAVNAVAVDGQGNIYVAGETTSVDFPTTNALQSQLGGGNEAFVAKFSRAGVQSYSTYLGGLGDDRATAIAVDAAGAAYVTGSTYSPNFPVLGAFQAALGGGQDAFAAKLNPSGTALVYSTYLGGSGGAAGDAETGTGIAVDSAGCAYIAGETSSTNFPTLNPFQSALSGSEDAFVLKLSSSGNALVFATYLGGSSIDMATAIAVDSAGRAYVAGYTTSTDFPVANAVQPANGGDNDGFLVRLSATGSVLEMGTYLGSTTADAILGLALDSAGDVYLTGQTQSSSFPTVNAIQAYKLSLMSAFLGEVPNEPAPPPTANLVSYWSADGNANDAVSGYNGTLMNGVTFAAGKVNQAFSFNGASGYVQINGAGTTSGARTFSAWVYPHAGNGGMPIFTAGAPGAGDFLVISGNRIFIDHWGTAAYYSSIPVTPEAWNHVAVTYDGATIQFYVNGVAASPLTGALYNYSIGTWTLGGNTIGGSTAGVSFNGLIDEVRLYSRALTAAEIQLLAAAPNAGPIAYWSADGNANDAVSGYNGTLMNGVTFAAGKVNQAFSFNGASGYVQINGAGTTSGARTFSAWVYPHAGNGGMPIFTAGAPGAGDFLVISGNRIFIDHWGTAAYYSSIPVTPEAWKHVAVTYDGATIQFYVNGVAAQPISGTLYNYGIGTLTIGGNTIGGTTARPSFNGLIDEVRLYARVLSSAEIQSLYNPDATNSYWSADGNANDTVSGYNGSLMGGATFAAGKVNRAFSINGTAGYVQISGIGTISGARTFAAWVYPHAGTGGLPVFTAGAPGAGDFLVIRGNRLFIDHWGTPAYYSSIVVVPEAWNHVAVTYDGSTIQFYVNGVAAVAVSGSLYNYSIGTLTLGGNMIGGSSARQSLNGLIDEVYLYGRVLSPSEIQALQSAT